VLFAVWIIDFNFGRCDTQATVDHLLPQETGITFCHDSFLPVIQVSRGCNSDLERFAARNNRECRMLNCFSRTRLGLGCNIVKRSAIGRRGQIMFSETALPLLGFVVDINRNGSAKFQRASGDIGRQRSIGEFLLRSILTIFSPQHVFDQENSSL